MNRMIENLICWCAWHVPRRLAYWCTIRLAGHATGPDYPTQEVPALLVIDALERWKSA